MYDSLTKDAWKKRDNIIFGEANLGCYAGGVRRFTKLSLEQLQQLRQNHFISPLARQNNSPSVQEFQDFMEKYDGYTAMGYVVTPQREDCRVTLDGLEKSTPITDPVELSEFQQLFRCADEIVINHTYVWYD